MGKKKLEPTVILCMVCGDKGSVPRMYTDPHCGAGEGRQLVPCPKCKAPNAQKTK